MVFPGSDEVRGWCLIIYISWITGRKQLLCDYFGLLGFVGTMTGEWIAVK